jgi:hypothetical protein
MKRGAATAVALAGFALASASQESAFEGTWTASGRRQSIPLESGRSAAIVEISGAVVLTLGDGLSRGFHGEAIGFDDGEGLVVGRSVWTDENGDQLFSRLQGEPLEKGRRFTGTIMGGTGRYEGYSGEYSFTWQYLLSSEDGMLQGRAVGLSGRVLRGPR